MYPGTGLDGHNNYTEVELVAGCKQTCTAIPMCLNFEKVFGSLNSTCNLAEVTALDVPDDFNGNNGYDIAWNFYQRNCA